MGGEGEGHADTLHTIVNQQLSHGRLSVITLSGNPLRPSAGIATRMQVSSDQPRMVQFGIYDAQGRLVARLLRDVAVAGRVEVRWNGLDLQGQRVPPGTYFYRAASPDARVTGRIIVLH
jgi:flagellar hook assembly protein FlgD